MDSEVISQGAEAVIRKQDDRVLKERVEKSYRHPLLDARLRKSRTKRESKVLQKARDLGVSVPELFITSDFTLEMAFVDGPRLKTLLLENPEQYANYLRQIGEWLACLHQAHIIHGDLTTSNMLVDSKGQLYMIDFGLSFFSTKIEDMAVDLHLLEQAIESTHHLHKELFFEAFLKGYAFFEKYTSVLSRLEQLRLRGRYVKKHQKRQQEAHT